MPVDPAFKHLIERVQHGPALGRLRESLFDKGARGLELCGASASLRAVALAGLLDQGSGLILLEDLNDVEELFDDLVQLLGSERVFQLPMLELLPYDEKSLPLEARSALTEILQKLRMGDEIVLLAGARQLMLRYPEGRGLDRGLHILETGMELDRDELVAELAAAGFQREAAVEDIGSYALRGGILDLYPFGIEFPLRLEFFGDQLESIRAFDPGTQVSTESLAQAQLSLQLPHDLNQGECLLSLFRKECLLVCPPEEALKAQLDHVMIEAERSFTGQPGAAPPGERYQDPQALLETISTKRRLELHPSRRIEADGDQVINLNARGQESFMRNVPLLVNNLRALHEDGYRSAILCDNHGQRDRLQEILDELGLEPGAAELLVGSLNKGFIDHDSRTAIYTDHEIFGRPRMRRHVRRFKRATVLRRLENLEVGDQVVHVRFGVGVFEGLTSIQVNGHEREVLKLRYQGEDRIYVRLEDFRDVEKYSGREGELAPLSKLGTGEWERTKTRTRKSIQKVAKQLVELYARRRMSPGHAFGQDTVWQKEMEAAFEFEETVDQLSAIDAVKQDMEASWPMDRLICGDVGFGKTEVAVRAVFKALSDGKQAAVLVPTTILAQQHFQTFGSRYAEFPARVEVVSRFRSKAEQKEVLADLKEGKVDVLIGTHRLLSKDVVFKDLGLLVVDEEQRFGVMHKEKIKALRANLDVITMTATPIPRTLDMAMLGIKDLSLVNVPPSNRLPIETEILPFNKKSIRSAILRELDRNGQVYFVHNRVQTIDSMAALLKELVPEARFAIGHGQMKEGQLEKVMLEFMHRDYDVLISTMIIESGLDIPNVNTMIVNRADTLGLAQLYQLRGRIGRSHRQAYAYLLTPPAFEMNLEAKKRLHTIGEFTDLGSGFKIAMRDLEIRGAGNLLGAEQSGHVAAVGYELYNRLLEEAILELKHEEAGTAQESRPDCRVELPMDALLPADYVESDGERVNLYRRLQQTEKAEEVLRLRDEVTDRFGSMPKEAWMLFQLVELQTLGRQAGLKLIDMRRDQLTLRPMGAPHMNSTDFLAALRHLDDSWPLDLEDRDGLLLSMDQRGMDWNLKLDLARKLLRALLDGQKQASEPFLS